MDKASLRRDFLQKRMNLTNDEVSAKNDLITRNLIESIAINGGETVHIFLPQINKKEIDTWNIIRQLQTFFPKIRIVAPYVIPKPKEMEHYVLDAQTRLNDNQWGIPEPDPSTSRPVYVEEIDIIYIPLLTFDERGYRVGYGGGYYDRFLAKCRPNAVKTGLSFFEPVTSIVDINEYDIRMDACITPEKIWIW
ncbi:5-formyltetrahydrofolate cyclo-ligase [Dyadobacter fanqingshengii]|uniref:5-formyltetrahydrofolate cyclo-ligase n=1 Tax=Dyadobacter fanqingshengii TaxID=2906443 RepID=A0A9X1PFV5_9BACT|nr:5-formyltetrahydrofolate cyclo-ligase [Dyadobacter fanqingshengii]MCF0042507.1 5-formyltetrahydrofolate cyclo-ligase [Dyadobacter fanqingshengii]USJ34970.1 5-formyltetrahydrofolate cyclo-ligase [Dyadobacter fanqingshengii]